MKGLFELTPDSLNDLADEAISYIENFDIEPYRKEEYFFSILRLRKIKKTYYSCPFWHQEEEALINHFNKLKINADRARKSGDKIFMSELSYTNIVMLINGNDRANPVFIRNY